MTERERNQIAGRFHIISRSPLVVGTIGSLWPHDLSAAQLDYIKAFYNAPGRPHEFLEDWPVEVNHSLYNGFILIKEA
jgi:hypothetical protein